MKVIKPGNIKYSQLLYPKQITCKVCNAILEIEKHDVKDGDFGSGDYVQCPECKTYILIK